MLIPRPASTSATAARPASSLGSTRPRKPTPRAAARRGQTKAAPVRFFFPDSQDQVDPSYDFDRGISVDHVILDYQPETTPVVKPLRPPDPEWAKRQKLTLEYAAEFLRLHRKRRPRFQPLGVAQGWSPRSYAHAVQVLQTIG